MSTVVSKATNASSSRQHDDHLWRSAYRKLKHDPDGKKVLEKFQKAVQKESAENGIALDHLGSKGGRQKLIKLINMQASALESHHGTYDKVVQTILKTKDVVSTGAAASPPAAIAVAGIFMVFTIHQEYLKGEQAMFDCVILIARIIGRRAVEHGECHGKPLESKELKELRQQLQISYLELYFKLLSSIAKLVYKLSIPSFQRKLDTLVGWTDWVAEKASLQEAERECIDDLDAIDRYKSNPAAQPSPYWRKGRNKLHQNAAIGIEGRVAELVETNSFDPNEKTTNGETALSLAAEGGHLKCCQILLEVRGIDKESQNDRGRTALHTAALKDRVAIVRALIRKGANVNVEDNDRRTPLHLAAEAGRFKAVEVLCGAKDIKLDLSDLQGRTALHLAALKRKRAVVKLLSQMGASIDRKDSKKRTAFLDAAEVGNVKLVKTLHECGAAVNQTTATHKWSALHICASSGHSRCLGALLALPNVDINMRNTKERTPLHEAVLGGRTSMVKALCDAGATADTRDKKKRTPFLDAANAGDPDMVTKLHEKGADINQVSGVNKWSALHEAAKRNKIEMVRYLVNEGINTGLTIKGGTKKGMTARQVAEECKSRHVLEFLRLWEAKGETA